MFFKKEMINVRSGNILIALLVFLFSACTPKTTEEYLQEAALMEDQGQYQGAIIELKNALTTNPTNPKARMRLGKVYYLSGQFSNAEKELRNARDLGVAIDDYLPILVKSIYYQNDFGRAFLLSDDVAGLNQQALSSVDLFHYLSSLKDDSLEPIINPPSSLLGDDKLIATGFSKLAKNMPSEAADTLPLFTDSTHEPVEKAMLAALTYISLTKTQMAIEEYLKVINIFPEYYIAHFQLIELYIFSEQLDQAEERLDNLFDINPKAAYVNLLKAKVDFKQDDFANALLNSELSIQAGLSNTEILFIAGVSAYKIDKIETARQYLMMIKNNISPVHIGNKILAEVNMKLGYTEEALEQAAQAELSEKNRANLLSTAAIQQFQSGNFSQAIKYIGEANQYDPGNAVNLLKEGFMKLSANDQSGLDNLSEAIRYDQSIDEAWMLLAESHLKNGDTRAALDITEKWRQINQVAGMSLKGYVFLKANKIEQAKKIFEELLILDNAHMGATRYLMLINARQENFDQAEILSIKLVEKSPERLSNILNYINIGIAQEKVSIVEEYLEIMINKDPTVQAPIIGLALLHSWKNKPKEALKILDSKGDATNPQIMMVKGDIYNSLGLMDEALGEYHSWTDLYPKDSVAWFKKIELLGKKNNSLLALQATEEALRVFPNEPRLRALNSEFLAKSGKVKQAREQFSTIEKYKSSIPELKRYNGIIAYKEQKYDEAKHLLTEYYALMPSFDVAEIIAYSMQELGEAPQGGEFLEEALTKLSTTFRDIHTLAEYYATNDLLDKSAKIYQSLFEEFPQNFITVNNYAALLIRMNELDKAEELATVALQLMPKSGFSLDTYGWVLFKQGKFQEALTYINLANKALPENTEIQLHLAEVFLANGDTAKANRILDKIKPESLFQLSQLNELKSKLNI
jgi:putative PEP-CTERM system TPR-repeat lipoprotein